MRKQLFIVATILLCCGIGLAAFWHTTEYTRMSGQSGRFYAVAEYRTYLSFIPMMPGSSSDKPGFVTIYTRDGESCGRASLPMLQDFYSLQWLGDTAEIPMVAQWDLSKRKVHQIQ